MKKIIGVLSLAVMMLTLSSCEVETSQNGDLDGFWHLEQVDTLATGVLVTLQISACSGAASIS